MTADVKFKDKPAISVIVATPDNYRTVRQLVRYLARQTVREQMEIVFVVPSRSELNLEDGELQDFLQYRVVEIGPFKTLNHARVSGIREAAAPVVVLTEDHCFPAPAWAEALVEAHKGQWAAVGPAVGLANMHCLQSWANYFIQYAPWMKPTEGGVVEDLPGHNSSYKKVILMSYGKELESMMDFEYVLHQDLRRKGLQLYMTFDAESYHLFMTKMKPFLAEHFCIGQLLAASRASSFLVEKRIFLLLTTPLLPCVRFIRILRRIYEFGWKRELLPGIIPWLLLALTVSAAGEFMGYAFGKGRSQLRTLDLDFNRDRFVSEKEKNRIWCENLVDFTTVPARPTFNLAP